jgi:hypothetical protein
MSNNSVDIKTDTITSNNITIVIIVITIISLVCLGVEFTKKNLTDGIVISVSIILMTFIYFFVLIVKKLIFNKSKSQFNIPYVLFIVTFLIIIGLLITFIMLFPSSVIKKINKSQLFNNTDSELYNLIYGFMFILSIYIFLSLIIYSTLMSSKENINIYIYFALAFSICEIFVLLRLSGTLKNITDG